MNYKELFVHLPQACAVLHERFIVECNLLFCEMWHGCEQDIVGKSFSSFYTSETDFESRGKKIGPILAKEGFYADSWLMRRCDGDVFWCHVNGTTLDRSVPYHRVIWIFTDLSERLSSDPPSSGLSIGGRLTPREREVAKLLYQGHSSKEIARMLDISHRTVHIHRSSLLKKYSVANTTELLKIIAL